MVESGTPADGFGQGLDATRRHPAVRDALDSAIATTQRPGPFGADLVTLREHAAGAADAFDDVGSDTSLLEPLENLQQPTRLHDELLFAFGERLGWCEHIENQSVTGCADHR